MLIVTSEAYGKLSKSSRAELLRAVLGDPSAAPSIQGVPADNAINVDWTNRVDLSPGQIEEFFTRELHENTVNGMRAIALHGSPIASTTLEAGGVTDIPAFQRSTTRRVRSLTGDSDAFMLAWNLDEWANGVGHYAVTPATLRSIKIYFEND